MDGDTITYRPWKPKPGFEPAFTDLRKKLGPVEDWPESVRESICDRGEPLPLVFDPACRQMYSLTPMSFKFMAGPGVWSVRLDIDNTLYHNGVPYVRLERCKC